MGSSRPTDRSLGETTFLPQWMKGKLDTRFDYSDSTFSPPADEAGFFYIRYPKNEEAGNNKSDGQKDGFRPINEIFGHTEGGSNKSVDLSKHPLPCQQFIASNKVTEPKIVVANKPKVRPAANDDFNNSTTSECGRSIVNVATQIMSSKFSKTSSADSASSNNEESLAQYQQQRRGSKSLPASPTITPEGSPKSRRRNRFFAGAFVPVEGTEGRKTGWLLNSIIGQSRELINATKIEEEEEVVQPEPVLPPRAISRKKSISSQNLTYVGTEDKPKIFMQPKPSELREMNFWSPTSM